jgi:hypothetical protein
MGPDPSLPIAYPLGGGKKAAGPGVLVHLSPAPLHPTEPLTPPPPHNNRGICTPQKLTQLTGVVDLNWFQRASGSSVLDQCGSGYEVLMSKNCQILQLKKIRTFLYIKNVLSQGLHEGRPSYRRGLQPSTENIKHLTTLNFLTFFYFCG